MFVTCPIKNSVYFFGSFLINKRLSFTGVSSALSVLFVFPVQALTETFNYSCRCLVETKVPIFSSRSYST